MPDESEKKDTISPETEAEGGAVEGDEAGQTEEETAQAETGTPEPEPEPAEAEAGSDPEDNLEAALASAPLVASGAAAASDPAEAESADEEIEEVEEASGSLAARVLTWLVLLLAGGGLALWGGPQIAPHLPSGLGPVKAWLTPGQAGVSADLAAVKDEMNSRFADLAEADENEDILADAQTMLAATTDEISGRVDTLDERLQRVESTDVEALVSRLSQVETKLAGLATQLESLSALEPAEGLSDDGLAQIQQFSATIDGLRAEIADLSANDGALAQRLEDVASASQRRVEEAETEAAAASSSAEEAERVAVLSAAVASIEAALTSGAPYAGAMGQIAENGTIDVPEILAANAEEGVPTLAVLRTEFTQSAGAAIRADIKAASVDAGPLNRFGAFLQQQVSSRSLTEQEGSTTDAVLSRVEARLKADDVPAALEEAKGLSEAARGAMDSWLSRATAHVEAGSALASFADTLLATN